MIRKRLKSTTGCVRCRNRHHKCDEKRPKCSFCAKYDVPCVWPFHLQSQPQERQETAAVVPRQSHMIGMDRILSKGGASLDPFHELPVHYHGNPSTVTNQLHTFFVELMRQVLPLDVASTQRDLTRGWLILIHSDAVVCSAFVTYCAWFYARQGVKESKPTSHSLATAEHSLRLLRRRVESNEVVKEGTLLAATLHFFTAIINTDSIAQLSQIARGIVALVAAQGGPCKVLCSISPSTRQSLIFVDVVYSALSANKPFLEDFKFPTKPNSVNSLYTSSPVNREIADVLGDEVTKTLQDQRFVLFFRSPSQQTRVLSREESDYLLMLVSKINYDLCRHQNQLVNSLSLAEIAVYGMFIASSQVITFSVQHPIISKTLLQRLKRAVLANESAFRHSCPTVVLWSATMALLVTRLEEEIVWARRFIVRTLNNKYGLEWPSNWTTELRSEVQSVLWHQRIETMFQSICQELGDLHTHESDRPDDRTHVINNDGGIELAVGWEAVGKNFHNVTADNTDYEDLTLPPII